MKETLLKYFLILVCHLISQAGTSQVRAIIDFNKDWKFFLGNDTLASQPGFDDRNWRQLTLPHDWSIESDFSKAFPATNQGGALPGGIGWYRKTFVLPSSARNKNVRVEFDGIYRNSEVWINGHYLGRRPNGYISFQYELSPYIRHSPAKNVISVRVDNSQQPNSRWYTGSGIYRNTRLVISGKISIPYNGVFISTPSVSAKEALIHVKATIRNTTGAPAWVELRTDIYDASGKLITPARNTDKKINIPLVGSDVNQTIRVINPKLWSVETPNLLKAVIKVFQNGVLIDSYSTPIGIRYFHFDKDKGFFLNGKPLKILGICNHHDLGALGAAVNTRAIERQLEILKAMGCNAIRTAHNPPAPELLDLCDKMGFLVMDEAFDMWQKRKNRFDYHLDFAQWHKKDLEDMVLRDRNHPSVFMWSIGNEIREQFDSTGIALTKELVQIVKDLDTTRPVTNALTENFPEKNHIYQSHSLDVLGFNYKLDAYDQLPARFPGEKILASETMSALATRGHYDFPADSNRLWPPDSKGPFTQGNPDLTVSAYDHVNAYWGSSHEAGWKAVKDRPFIAGIFVWSGFDFLGEPVPYPWPARSSYYGIIDLAGFPKDVYYMYQSEWTKTNVLHVFPHWNWTPAKMIDVWAYYNNADEVELYLDGRSLGRRSREKGELHVSWRVPFSPGTLKAISRRNGKTILTREIRTAGKPARLVLSADRKNIRSDGKDLSFVTATVVDINGNPVPIADNLLQFSVAGEGRIAGTDNGYQADTVSLKSNKRKCWKGMALAIIQSTEKQGNITLKVSSQGLTPAILALKTSN